MGDSKYLNGQFWFQGILEPLKDPNQPTKRDCQKVRCCTIAECGVAGPIFGPDGINHSFEISGNLSKNDNSRTLNIGVIYPSF